MVEGAIFPELENALQIFLISHYFDDNGWLFSF